MSLAVCLAACGEPSPADDAGSESGDATTEPVTTSASTTAGTSTQTSSSATTSPSDTTDGTDDTTDTTDATDTTGGPVLPCDALPDSGTWENITPQSDFAEAVNGTVGAAIIVDPFDARRVWLGTGGENDEIWRSDDCGASWAQVNTGPGSVGDGMTFGGVGDGAQWSMMVDHVTPDLLFAVSGYGAQSLWRSTDGGQAWTDVLVDEEYNDVADYRFVNNVSLDANDHQHLVVSTHGGCAAPYQPSCMAETLDGGETWRMVTAPEGWFEGGGVVIVEGDTWVWCGSSLMITQDAGATWTSDNLAGGGSCEAEYTIRPLAPTSNGNYYLGSRGGVIRSADGVSWEHVANTSGNMVMLAHGTTHLFAADQWTPTLRRAALVDDETWEDMAAPTDQIGMGHDGGIPFLAYDDAHGVLYASMFSGGVARMVVGD
ncbi:MAG TPA: hypothetical protein VG755_33315 [Nannocystaceae bacterium]|nr:hypothetical protein [Nannocystaceae bacterium]